MNCCNDATSPRTFLTPYLRYPHVKILWTYICIISSLERPLPSHSMFRDFVETGKEVYGLIFSPPLYTGPTCSAEIKRCSDNLSIIDDLAEVGHSLGVKQRASPNVDGVSADLCHGNIVVLPGDIPVVRKSQICVAFPSGHSSASSVGRTP